MKLSFYNILHHCHIIITIINTVTIISMAISISLTITIIIAIILLCGILYFVKSLNTLGNFMDLFRQLLQTSNVYRETLRHEKMQRTSLYMLSFK